MDRARREYNQIIGVFPEVVWISIIDLLDPASIQALYNSSPGFFNILHSRRVKFLFHQVLPVLVPYFDSIGLENTDGGALRHDDENEEPHYQLQDVREEDTEESDGEVEESDGEDDETGKVVTPRVLRCTLQCRLVCKDWCSTVDNVLNTKSTYGETDVWESCLTHRWITIWKSKDNRKLRKFLSHFNDTHNDNSTRSPLISRRLRACFGDLDDSTEFSMYLAQIFDKFGHHFKQLQVVFHDDIDAGIYVIISNLIRRLRNLEWLQLQNLSDERPEYILFNPMTVPEMGNLLVLKLQDVSVPFADELIPKSIHLKKLDIRTSTETREYNMAAVMLLNLYSFRIIFRSAAHFKRFYQVMQKCNQHVHLQNVKLFFNDDAGVYAFVPFGDIWDSVQRCWNHSLQELEIHMPKPQNHEHVTTNLMQCQLLDLHFPCLHKLKLWLYNHGDYDFLLGLKDTLVLLDITPLCRICKCSSVFGCHTSTIKKRTPALSIQLIGYDDNIMESNIWNLIPKLEKLKVMNNDRYIRTTYTRRQYRDRRIQ